jgi:hypothetical protein
VPANDKEQQPQLFIKAGVVDNELVKKPDETPTGHPTPDNPCGAMLFTYVVFPCGATNESNPNIYTEP